MDVEIEKPHVPPPPPSPRAAPHWIEFAIPVAALFVSFVSIFIAWHHGQVMKELVHQNEKLVEANSLPYLQIDSEATPASRGHALRAPTRASARPRSSPPRCRSTADPVQSTSRADRRLLRSAAIHSAISNLDAAGEDGPPRRHRAVCRFRTAAPAIAIKPWRSIVAGSPIGSSLGSAIARCSTIAGSPTAATRRPTRSTSARRRRSPTTQ